MSILVPAPPVSAGLGGTQPVNPPGMAGLGPAERATNAAIQAVIGPSYKGYENYVRGQAWGMTTSGNLNQTAVIDRPFEPPQIIHELMAEGLNELVSFFEVKSIDPSDRLVKSVALVFNASRWPRITDLTQGDQDMHSSFKTEAATVQVGKMAEVDVKTLQTAAGRRMWYERLKQASNGLMNTIVHFCITALLSCSPDKLARTAGNNYIAPYTARMNFKDALALYIGQFNVVGKGPHGINDLATILQTIQQLRDNSRYDSLIADVGFVNRLARGMSSWTLDSLVHSLVGIPDSSDTKSFVLKHAELRRILEVGSIAVGPNGPKVPPFTRNVMIATHQLIPCNATDIRIFDRRLDTWVDLPNGAALTAGAINLTGAGAIDPARCSVLIFTVYQAQTGTVVVLDTNQQRPQLHMSSITSATTIGGDQLKLGFYAAMTIAAVVPNKNAVLHLNDVVLRQITRGGGLYNASRVTNTRGGGAGSFDLKNHRTRVCFVVRNEDIFGLHGDLSILSLFGMFPASMTNSEPITTWQSRRVDAAGRPIPAGAEAVNHFGEPVAIAGQFTPESVINGQITMPYLSTRDACMYTDAANVRKMVQPNGIFGKHAYEGCTADMMGALGSSGYLRPYSADVIRVNGGP